MTISPAGSRDFRLIWAGTTAGRLGEAVASVATPLVALTVLDAGPFTVTLLTAAAWLPWLLIGLPAGAIVDRLAKRPVMIAADVTSAVAIGSVPAATALDHLTVTHLLLAALVLGAATVFFQSAWAAYLPAVLDEKQLVGANALLYGSESASRVAGPGLAGLLAGAVGAVSGLAVQAGAFAFSAVCLLLVRRPERRPLPPLDRHLWREVGEGIRYVRHDRIIRRLALHGAVSNLPLTGYQALLVVFLVREIGLSPGTVGLLLTLTALGGVAGAALVQPLVRRLGEARTLVVCKAGAGPCALIVPFTDRGVALGLFVVASTLVILGITAGNVVSASFRQRWVDPGMLSRVMTSIQVVNLGTIPLGAVSAGALANLVGTRESLAVMTVAYAASGLMLVFGPLRGLRNLPSRSLRGTGLST